MSKMLEMCKLDCYYSIGWYTGNGHEARDEDFQAANSGLLDHDKQYSELQRRIGTCKFVWNYTAYTQNHM